MTERKVVNEFKALKKEYAYRDDIFSEDDNKISLLKYIIDKKLNQVDQTIILMYADCQSYRKLGKQFGMSHMTIRKEVVRIKNLIMKEYERIIAY